MSVTSMSRLGFGCTPPPARAVSYSPPAFGSGGSNDRFVSGSGGTAATNKFLDPFSCCCLAPILSCCALPIALIVAGASMFGGKS